MFNLEKIDLSINSLTKNNCILVKNVISKYYKKKISFKPPNDLLINKKKICGILQEKIEKSKKEYLIVGIGLNLDPGVVTLVHWSDFIILSKL